MNHRRILLSCVVLFFAGTAAAVAADKRPTAGEKLEFDVAALAPRGVTATVEDEAIRVVMGRDARWPSVNFRPAEGKWDLSAVAFVSLDVKNLGDRSAEAELRVDSQAGDGKRKSVNGSRVLAPGEQQTVTVLLRRAMSDELRKKLFGMRGYPGGYDERKGIDPTQVAQIVFRVARSDGDRPFEISNLRTGGRYEPVPEKPFPMIDVYGQYRYKDWPNKVKSEEDFARRKAAEDSDLDEHPGPADWNGYGGWATGPKLEATGRFYPAKHDGKWWLVDPEGRLFWSHGVDCVRTTTAYTPITDREHYFAALPERSSPLAEFYGRGSWAPHGYYVGKSFRTFNFTAVNLLRKYGDDWERIFAERTHRRLRSWAVNTIANWSDPEIYLRRKTPYTTTVSGRSREIEGSSGYWGKFPDPFDPSLRESLDRRLAAERGRSIGDPWCIGYFVSNELSWGDDTSLAVAALASPADQPVKRIFVDRLKQTYESIEKLNQAWGTGHASWDALLESATPPDAKKASSDLGPFTTTIAEEYFRVCRDAVKAADPAALYLGCRFAWVNDRAAIAAAKFCDVISYNRYSRSVADLAPPGGLDKPLVIGEFHFGALDRGMLHTGLVPCRDQQERADAYRRYVEGALDNPYLVGTHWFQYGDQATTGRGDGENYQIGFLDVCDTPYRETIDSCRAVGNSMYERRSGR
jgi:hypothetical protein